MSHSTSPVAPSEGWERSISAAITATQTGPNCYVMAVRCGHDSDLSPADAGQMATVREFDARTRYSRVQPIIRASAETHVDRKSPAQIAASTIELHCTLHHSALGVEQPRFTCGWVKLWRSRRMGSPSARPVPQ